MNEPNQADSLGQSDNSGQSDNPGPSDNSRQPLVKPFSVDSVAWEEWREGERFDSRVRQLSKLAGAAHVGVLMEELPSGTAQSSS